MNYLCVVHLWLTIKLKTGGDMPSVYEGWNKESCGDDSQVHWVSQCLGEDRLTDEACYHWCCAIFADSQVNLSNVEILQNAFL